MIRQHMIDYRNCNGISLQQMSRICKCSPTLLENLEDGIWITHPNIATRVAVAYQMTVEQYNDLIPERLHTDGIPPVKPLPTYGDYMRFMKEIRNDRKPRKEETEEDRRING